jgi:Skp family chaperone for outer membrane proteins
MCSVFSRENSVKSGNFAQQSSAKKSSAKTAVSEICKLIAVVDIKKVASSTNAGKSIENQIAKINNASKNDILDLEAKIKSMETNKSPDVDPRKVEDMQLILYDMVSTKKNQISEAYREAISVLESEINKAVLRVAQEDGIKIVLTSDAIVYMGSGCMDITQHVIALVNEGCKEIEVVLKQ